MNQHALIITIEREGKWSKVSIYDPTEGMDKPVMAQGEASNWRTALGEALSKIELPEPTINDIVKSEEESKLRRLEILEAEYKRA
jgi:hypothetical protein